MRAGERRFAVIVPEGIERVLHDVVARGADGVQEELTREGRQAEALPDLATVEHDGAEISGNRLAPFGHRAAMSIEERKPESDCSRAVT